MTIHSTTLRAFLFWLVSVGVGLVTYMISFGPLGSQLIQIALLGVPVAFSIIYFLFRATRLGKEVAIVLAVLWFFAPSFLLNLMPSTDGRVIMLLLLAISVSLNLALGVVLRRKALH